jgi:hypothetical protein
MVEITIEYALQHQPRKPLTQKKKNYPVLKDPLCVYPQAWTVLFEEVTGMQADFPLLIPANFLERRFGTTPTPTQLRLANYTPIGITPESATKSMELFPVRSARAAQ